MQGSQEPPKALVKTWIDLIQSSESADVKERANRMLINALGDMKAVAAFVQRHNLLK